MLRDNDTKGDQNGRAAEDGQASSPNACWPDCSCSDADRTACLLKNLADVDEMKRRCDEECRSANGGKKPTGPVIDPKKDFVSGAELRDDKFACSFERVYYERQRQLSLDDAWTILHTTETIGQLTGLDPVQHRDQLNKLKKKLFEDLTVKAMIFLADEAVITSGRVRYTPSRRSLARHIGEESARSNQEAIREWLFPTLNRVGYVAEILPGPDAPSNAPKRLVITDLGIFAWMAVHNIAESKISEIERRLSDRSNEPESPNDLDDFKGSDCSNEEEG